MTNTPLDIAALIERLRARRTFVCSVPPDIGLHGLNSIGHEEPDPLCQEAADALAALSTSAEMPREPTEAMIRVAEELDLGEDQWDHATIWRAMYDAATLAAGEKEQHGQPPTAWDLAHPDKSGSGVQVGPAPATPEAQSDLVEEIDAFLAGFPNGKPAAGFRFGELLQRARDALRERDAQLAALEPVVAAARASNGLAMTRELSEAIRSLDAQERKPERTYDKGE